MAQAMMSLPELNGRTENPMPAVSPIYVVCPTCGASSGWPCKTNTGAQLVGRYHDARIDLAKH
jgi:hypothetical protein